MKKIFLLALAVIVNVILLHAQDWSLSGNSISSGQFLGTTNGQSLVIKVSNAKSGFIDISANENTSFGYSALSNTSAGQMNCAFGSYALSSNSGPGNSAFGAYALYSNSSGGYNTAIGFNSLNNSSADGNTGVGASSLNGNSTGNYNTATGVECMFANYSGSYNSAYGVSSLSSNDGSNNSAFGYKSLYSNTYGYNNVAVGTHALYKNTEGHNLVAIGDSALYNQGVQGDSLYDNTGVGSKALFSNEDGWFNTALGSLSLYSNTSSRGNTAIGYSALYNVVNGNNTAVGTTALINTGNGSSNVAVGSSSLETNVTGSFNTAIGTSADVNANNYFNSTAIGYTSSITASNQVRIGNSSIASIGGFQAWTNLSDSRVKSNIKENVPGLKFINKLKPVTYTINISKAEGIVQHSLTGTGENEQGIEINTKSRILAEKTIHTGFLAQDVEKTANSMDFIFDGVDAPKNDKDLYGLRYSQFVVPLVKAVQELSAENDKKEEQITDLKKEMKEMKDQFAALMQKLNNTKPVISNTGSFLEQNSPNPFNSITTIKYDLSLLNGAAQLVITDVNGRLMKSMPLNSKAKGQITLNAGELSPGSYFYSLQVNEKIIETRQMIILK